MDDKGDLIVFARESATAGLDLYDLLGVDTTTSREDIHRAWRRQGLKYHPDKAGASFDASLYERFARARDVLVDDAAREVYDTGQAAAAQRKMQSDQMTAERRRFKDELEAAERATRGGAGASGEAPFGRTSGPVQSSEREKLREAGRRRAEAQQRQEQEARERLRQKEDDRIAEIERLLRDKEERQRRRAEKKAARSGGVADSRAETETASTERAERTEKTEKTEQTEKPASAQADPEWRKLLTGSRKAATMEGPVQERPLFAYTMDRLKAAGEAQRQRQARADGVSTPTFEPQWQEIDDPQVRRFITRVPRFGVAADVSMDMGSRE